uniref:MOSC domain-containing protein n=1 Tax=Heligmosomoides polygyrus TaxID=6339 RepID=A0A183GE30_HELPZ
LSNEAPYLVVNEASISILADVVGLSVSETVDRFRPNIVVRGIPPFLEDTARFMSIDNIRFKVTKKCTRCEMICVNPHTGLKEPQLIIALRNFRQREKVPVCSINSDRIRNFSLVGDKKRAFRNSPKSC